MLFNFYEYSIKYFFIVFPVINKKNLIVFKNIQFSHFLLFYAKTTQNYANIFAKFSRIIVEVTLLC